MMHMTIWLTDFTYVVCICYVSPLYSAVYTMFKPMQYYHERVTAARDPSLHAECELDSINETTEKLLGICVGTSVTFLIVSWLIGMMGCYVARRANNNEDRSASARIRCVKDAFIMFDKMQLVFAAVLALFFIIVMVYATVKMMEKRYHVRELELDNDENEVILILVIVVDTLSLTACFDIFFFQFCQDTCTNWYGRKKPWNISQEDEYRDYRRLGFGSIGGDPAVDSSPNNEYTNTITTMTSREQDSFN